MARWISKALFALALAGCSEELAEPGTALLVEGQDADAWTADPAPLEVEVEKQFADGTSEVLLTAPAPLERFSLGRGGSARFVVSARDGAGVVRARARSMPLDPAGFAEAGLPLFVSRSERFSRAPGALTHPQREQSPVATIAGRYLLIAGGSDGARVSTELYDFGSWQATPALELSCPASPCEFRSIAAAGTLVLAIGDSWAIWFDVAERTSGDLALPSGLASWADVAGGRTIERPDGGAYVVGATRTGAPTAWVVEVSPSGELAARAMFSSAESAAATWVEGRGLVVTGGGAGVEVLAPGAEAFTTISGFTNDPTAGAALVALDAGRVLRAGGRDAAGERAPTVELNLGCGGGSCVPEPRTEVVDLDRAIGFQLGDGELLFVGDDAAGETSGVRLGAEGAVSAPLRQPRKGGSAIATPTGHVAVVGGAHTDGTPALAFELFVR